jgi:hypothetical protein
MASLINPAKIDATYPIAGQDNDTQGFRTNYQNIKNNFTVAAKEITAVQSNVVTLQSQVYSNVNVSAYLTNYQGNISALTLKTLTVTSAIQFANLTTGQISAISPASTGMTVYNYTTGNIQVYNGTKWANIALS